MASLGTPATFNASSVAQGVIVTATQTGGNAASELIAPMAATAPIHPWLMQSAARASA